MTQDATPRLSAYISTYELDLTDRLPFQNDVSVLLVQRMEYWRLFIKGVIAFFFEISKCEKQTAESYRKCSQMQIISEKYVDKFSHESQMFKKIADCFQTVPTKMVKDHDAIRVAIENETLATLVKMKKEIKKRQKVILEAIEKRKKDVLKINTDLENSCTSLRTSIQQYHGIHVRKNEKTVDPWFSYLVYRNLVRTATDSYHQREDARRAEIEEFIVYETAIFHGLKAAITSFTSGELKHSEYWAPLHMMMDELNSEQETATFLKKVTSYTSEPKPEISTTSLNDECTRTLREGYLLRPKKMSGWKNGYFVLTASGFLHEFTGKKEWDSTDTADLGLVHSINLTECILGAHSVRKDSPSEFEIIEQKGSSFMSKSARVHRVKGQSMDETVGWWNAISFFVKMKLTAEHTMYSDIRPASVPTTPEMQPRQLAPAEKPVEPLLVDKKPNVLVVSSDSPKKVNFAMDPKIAALMAKEQKDKVPERKESIEVKPVRKPSMEPKNESNVKSIMASKTAEKEALAEIKEILSDKKKQPLTIKVDEKSSDIQRKDSKNGVFGGLFTRKTVKEQK